MEKMNFEQISKGPKFIEEKDLKHIVPLLRDHYRIDIPSEENITWGVVQHVWDKLGLHAENEDDKEGEMRQLAKEILELKY